MQQVLLKIRSNKFKTKNQINYCTIRTTQLNTGTTNLENTKTFEKLVALKDIRNNLV